jgi:hypothetical protein
MVARATTDTLSDTGSIVKIGVVFELGICGVRLVGEDMTGDRRPWIQRSGFEVIPCVVSKTELERELSRIVARMYSLGCNDEASNHNLHAWMRRSSLASCIQRDRVSRTAGRCNETKS